MQIKAVEHYALLVCLYVWLGRLLVATVPIYSAVSEASFSAAHYQSQKNASTFSIARRRRFRPSLRYPRQALVLVTATFLHRQLLLLFHSLVDEGSDLLCCIRGI